MQTRTWPYGTVKHVTVLKFSRCHAFGKPCTVTAVIEDKQCKCGEGFMLVDGPDEPERAPGTRGTITFTEGGPTGGYWKFQPVSGPEPAAK